MKQSDFEKLLVKNGFANGRAEASQLCHILKYASGEARAISLIQKQHNAKLHIAEAIVRLSRVHCHNEIWGAKNQIDAFGVARKLKPVTEAAESTNPFEEVREIVDYMSKMIALERLDIEIKLALAIERESLYEQSRLIAKSMPHLKFAPSKPGHLVGYASTDQMDLAGDRIRKGALQFATGSVKLLLDHDPDKPAGQIISLAYDRKGLRIEAQMDMSNAEVKARWEEAQAEGFLNFSVGFTDGEAAPSDMYRRDITKATLREVSIVMEPCNPGCMMIF
jgi:HK97 family phage prohead protease